MKALRWAAVPLASIAAWYVSLFMGIMAGSSSIYFCTSDLIVSGACTAWWHSYLVDAIVVLFAGVAAFLIVVSAVLMAPSYKLHVAWAAYISGCVFAIYALSQTSAFGAFIAAVLSGLLAIFCVARFLSVSMLPNQALNTDAPKDGAPVS